MIINALFFFLVTLLFIWWLWRKSHFSLLQISIILPIGSLIFLLALALSLYLPLEQKVLPLFLRSSTIEESSRSLIFLFITPLRKKYFIDPLSQLKFAFIVGFIFALLENVGYIFSLSLHFFIMRALITTPLHIFLSMVQIRWKVPGLLFAWLLHTLYNLAYESSFIIMTMAQIFTILLWFFIIIWFRKYKEKSFSAF